MRFEQYFWVSWILLYGQFICNEKAAIELIINIICTELFGLDQLENKKAFLVQKILFAFFVIQLLPAVLNIFNINGWNRDHWNHCSHAVNKLSKNGGKTAMSCEWQQLLRYSMIHSTRFKYQPHFTCGSPHSPLVLSAELTVLVALISPFTISSKFYRCSFDPFPRIHGLHVENPGGKHFLIDISFWDLVLLRDFSGCHVMWCLYSITFSIFSSFCQPRLKDLYVIH